MCSPAGAAIALTMVAAGARGETPAEMLRALHIEAASLDQAYAAFAAVLSALEARDGEGGLVLTVADRVCIDKDLPLRPDYASLLRDPFRAPIVRLDFLHDNEAALLAINRWAAEETHGRIPRILDEVEGPLVLANAIYMLGQWQQPFPKSATADHPFTSGAGRTSVKMMSQRASFRYAQVPGAKLVELPYQGGLSMLVILPDSVDGLAQVEDRMGDAYPRWMQALEWKDVDLKLPHFTVEAELGLNGLLWAMGIHRAFLDGADFSGMVEGRSLALKKAIQKAWIETSEKGTEAAAVTALGVIDISDVDDETLPPVVFHADHPFVYLIRDSKSGIILFMGRLATPAS